MTIPVNVDMVAAATILQLLMPVPEMPARRGGYASMWESATKFR